MNKSVITDRVAIYLRLSDEDENKLNKEQLSESIKNQKRMLKDYALEQGWKIVGIYNDEDYSGADKTRPEFNKMIHQCEKGNVDIVLCKTQSRFTRDMELVEKYLHNKFVEWNVRFISIVDNADTANVGNKKSRQINGLINEWFLEDTSINIRETFRNKREHGLFTGSFAPYGYIKDPENKNHLIIDKTTQDVIKKIYYDYASGASLESITKYLNTNNILCPFEYKKTNGSNLKIPFLKDYTFYKKIQKTGTYIITNTFFNNQKKIINDLMTIDLLTCDKNNFTDKIDIKLLNHSNKMSVYYSYTPLEKLNIKNENGKLKYNNINFNTADWIKLNKNDQIPKNVTCIGTYTKILDRLNEIKYEFEIALKENTKHLEHEYLIMPTSNTIDVDISFSKVIRKKFNWCTGTIKKILKDEVYIGNLIQFKTTTVSYKNKKIIYNNKEKQIIKKGTHEPIIDKNIWQDVQDRLKKNAKSTNNGSIHILATKLFCDNCHQTFYKCGSSKTNKYLCCRDRINKWTNCTNNKFIKEEELHNFIIKNINYLLEKYYNEKQLLKLNNNMIENELFKEKVDSLKKEEKKVENKLNNKYSYLQKLYEDYSNGIVDIDEYISLKTKYKQDNSSLESRIQIIKNELDNIENKKNCMKDIKTIFRKYKHINTLSREFVNEFIDSVYIGQYDKSKNIRNIRVIWNFKT